MTVAQKIKELSAMPDVLVAEPDYWVQVYAIPSDTEYSGQWHHPKISSPVAWDTTTGTGTVKVCIIDSGMRIDHPDLAANVVKGWNVIPLTDNGPYPQPTDPAWQNYNDTLRHGTHVSGLIGAIGNNNRGVAGVAWRVALMPCRFIGDSGGGYISDAITCMHLCRDEGALIYSNSWGGVEESDILLSEITALEASNGIFVSAAGNNGADLADTDPGASALDQPSFPAAYDADNQITVAATTAQDELAGFSNYGVGDQTVGSNGRNAVHLAAPGDQILSSTYDGSYGIMSGTSMATPVVSGAAALLQSMALSVGPPLAPAVLRQLLMDTVDPIIGGSSTLVSGGRLNIARAVQQLKTQLVGGQWPLSDALPITPPPASPLLPQVPPTPPLQSPPPPPGVGAYVMPLCGASPLRGQAASQSSTFEGLVAEDAVNGDCRTNATAFPSACASTDPSQSDPWWAVSLGQQAVVDAVAITTRADCCWNTISSAQVLVGNGSWTGIGNEQFAMCGQVSSGSAARGQRITVNCSQPLLGDSIAVYLPKLMTALTLCEVDAAMSALSPSPTSAPPPAKRRSRALLEE